MSRSKRNVEYAEVYSYLSRKEYNPMCVENRKRVIRRFCESFILADDGHLWRVKPGPVNKKWINEREAQQQVLQSAHVSGPEAAILIVI